MPVTQASSSIITSDDEKTQGMDEHQTCNNQKQIKNISDMMHGYKNKNIERKKINYKKSLDGRVS